MDIHRRGSEAVQPAEAASASSLAAMMLASTLLLAAALGVPHVEMLQDTFKSIVVAFGTLAAALLFFVQQRLHPQPVQWHPIVCLPLMLMAYALGSMGWSHTYLAGVEAVRWFIFALLLWLGLNAARDQWRLLAWAVHWAAVAASVWAGLQFWFDLRWLPQGAHPGSTFVNRNFFAEFVVCALPFTAMLLAQARHTRQTALLSLTGGLVVVALLMTGTRSALVALWLQLLIAFPLTAWHCRGQLALFTGPGRARLIAGGLLVATVLGLGSIPTGDPAIVAEGRGSTPIERALTRTQSIQAGDVTLDLRFLMWRATLNMIRARPLSGVGAGAWENELPLYQEHGEQVERDYYAHNEFLQLIAEYGVVGWLFLLGLLGYLCQAAWRTWRAATPKEQTEAPLRAFLLTSLLALMLVSGGGFPWRLAITGALFALCLAGLGASDLRLGYGGRAFARWKPSWSHAGMVASLGCMALASLIAERAGQSESRLVRAEQIAQAISTSVDFNDPAWEPAKREMLRLTREGIALNRHYRKITPVIADELAGWGDWTDAIWIWESVLSSRPNVVAILSNVARGYLALGQVDKAKAFLERARRIQPQAPAVQAVNVLLLAETGHQAQALESARQVMASKVYDFDLPYTAFVLAWRSGDLGFARQALETRLVQSPSTRAESHLLLGQIQLRAGDAPGAVADYRSALQLARPSQRTSLLEQIPRKYWPQLGDPSLPPGKATQTSANSG